MSYIHRTAIHKETWQSIQSGRYPYNPQDESYACGCRCHPRRPHEAFHLCDYHDGFDAGCEAIERSLSAEADR